MYFMDILERPYELPNKHSAVMHTIPWTNMSDC